MHSALLPSQLISGTPCSQKFLEGFSPGQQMREIEENKPQTKDGKGFSNIQMNPSVSPWLKLRSLKFKLLQKVLKWIKIARAHKAVTMRNQWWIQVLLLLIIIIISRINIILIIISNSFRCCIWAQIILKQNENALWDDSLCTDQK